MLDIPAPVLERWDVWRIVDKMGVSLREIETEWSLTDVHDANQWLDVQQDIQTYSSAKR